MRHILNSNTLRQLSFLEALFATQNWQPVDSFAKELGCSSRILRSDLLAINELYHPFHINVSQKNGILLEYPQNYSIDFIYAAILENSTEFQLLELLFFNDALTLDDLTEELYISSSSIHRTIKKINSTLAPLGFTIATSPYELKGDEAAIRFFFIHYFYERYLGTTSPITIEQQTTIDHLIKLLAQTLSINLSFPDLKLIRLTIATGIIRIKHGHIQKYQLETSEHPIFQLLLKQTDAIQQLANQFQLAIQPDDLIDLFYFFLRDDYALTVDYLYQVLVPANPQIKEIVQTIETSLNSLSHRLSIPLENKEFLTWEIYNVQRVFLIDNFILFNKKKAFRQNALAEYPLLIPLLRSELVKLTAVMEHKWTESALDEVLYMILIHWPNLNNKLEQFYATISIGIFCDYDTEHSDFLGQLITFHFGNSINITILTAQTEREALVEKQHYDLFITNLSCFDPDDAHVICINAVPTMHDWKNIQQNIKRIAASQDFITTRFIH